jgi:hypothetical protein
VRCLLATSGYAGEVTVGPLRTFVRKVLATQNLLARRARGALLKARWDARAQTSALVLTPVVDPDEVFARLDIVAINLDSRPDRLDEFTDEMNRLGVHSWRRLTAVDGRKEYPELDPFYSGSIGCSLSHVEAFEQAQWGGADALLVCEDDVEFLVDKATLAVAIQEFLDNPSLDVLALYGRARGGSHRISDNLRVVVGLVGTVCYVVKPHMTKVIGDLFIAGVADLQQGDRKGKSDVLWNRLQARRYFFASPVGSYTRNREGFSDIEGRLLGPR